MAVPSQCRKLKAEELRSLLSDGLVAEDSEEAVRLRGAEAAAAKEEELLAADLDLLRQFATTGTVSVEGKVHKARCGLQLLPCLMTCDSRCRFTSFELSGLYCTCAHVTL